jgi:hypothetical protein
MPRRARKTGTPIYQLVIQLSADEGSLTIALPIDRLSKFPRQ